MRWIATDIIHKKETIYKVDFWKHTYYRKRTGGVGEIHGNFMGLILVSSVRHASSKTVLQENLPILNW